MNRSALIARVANRNPHLHAQDAEAALATILDAVGGALARGDRVELRDFGTVSVRCHPVRIRRNPRTQVAVAIPARCAIRFRTGKALRGRLNAGPARDRSSAGTHTAS